VLSVIDADAAAKSPLPSGSAFGGDALDHWTWSLDYGVAAV